jgi:septum formation protein
LGADRAGYNGRMLILASQSPRRAELLRNAGIGFEVRPAEVDERVRAGELPLDYVQRLAQEKALAVLATSPAGSIVLGADTTVAVDGESLGKPVDAEDARRMLARLSGRSHEVLTGVCLARRIAGKPEGAEPEHQVDGRGVESGTGPTVQFDVEAEVTEVEFAALSEEEIAAYVAGGEPMDKAGAYAIQGRASRWIPRIRGCYFNVVGLPVARVCAMLRRAGNIG